MTNEELLKKYRSGTDVSEQLCSQNEDFVRDIAFKVAKAYGCLKYTDADKVSTYSENIIEELVEEGFIVFFNKLESYNFDAGAQLTTYLYPYIEETMRQWISHNIGSMSLSKSTMNAVRNAQIKYHNGMSVSEIAEEMHTSEYNAAWMINYNTHTITTSDLYAGEEDTGHLDNIPDIESAPVEQQAQENINTDMLEQIFSSLSEKDKFIIGHLLGVFGYEKYSLDEIALMETMTPDGVRKASSRAFKHLKLKCSESPYGKWID